MQNGSSFGLLVTGSVEYKIQLSGIDLGGKAILFRYFCPSKYMINPIPLFKVSA
jgi:hypothetical protein